MTYYLGLCPQSVFRSSKDFGNSDFFRVNRQFWTPQQNNIHLSLPCHYKKKILVSILENTRFSKCSVPGWFFFYQNDSKYVMEEFRLKYIKIRKLPTGRGYYVWGSDVSACISLQIPPKHTHTHTHTIWHQKREAIRSSTYHIQVCSCRAFYFMGSSCRAVVASVAHPAPFQHS